MAQGLRLSPPPPDVGEFRTPVLCAFSILGSALALQNRNPGVTVGEDAGHRAPPVSDSESRHLWSRAA